MLDAGFFFYAPFARLHFSRACIEDWLEVRPFSRACYHELYVPPCLTSVLTKSINMKRYNCTEHKVSPFVSFWRITFSLEARVALGHSRKWRSQEAPRGQVTNGASWQDAHVKKQILNQFTLRLRRE